MTPEMLDDIYDTLIGQMVPGAEVPGFPNLFAEGTKCDLLLGEIYAARDRLLDRLEIDDEDRDLEIMLSRFEQLMRIVAQKTFLYGMVSQER